MVESYAQNLAWIHAAVSEKPKFTDDGRTDGRWTTDACAITVALLTKSSRARNEIKINKTCIDSHLQR